MKNRNRLLIVIVVAGLALVLFWENKKLNTTLDNLENEVSVQKKTNQEVASDRAGSPETTPADATTGTHSGEVATNSANLNFAAWFAAEADNLDKKFPNPEQREAELRTKSAQLSPDEVSFLRLKATDPRAKANERIMAAYILTLGVENTQAALKAVASAPTSVSAPQPVHSLGETQLMHEKSIRIMAIDELFNRVKTNASLRKDFLEMMNQLKDPSLKQYAAKRYRELK